jgi:Histone methylation protein DOT1
MSSKAVPIRDMVKAFHDGNAIESSHLQRSMKLTPPSEGGSNDLPALLHRFGNQNFEFGTLSFRDLREIFRSINPRPNDLFCDAGAGYGHAVFYGASVAGCRFRAVEILPQRCDAMRKTAKRLGLDVEIVQGDALAQSYADVSYLFVNSPFFPDAAKRFADGLKARTEPLTVIAVHNIVDAFRADRDFVETEVNADLPNYCFGVFNWKKRGTRRRDDAHMPRR